MEIAYPLIQKELVCFVYENTKQMLDMSLFNIHLQIDLKVINRFLRLCHDIS